MNASEKLRSARILTALLTACVLMATYIIYTQYGAEISQQVTESVIKALPDLDSAVANR